MEHEYLTIAVLMLLASISPGPDFAIVVKNTLLHSRRAGIFTSFGVGTAILVHITYCALGLGLIISKSVVLFSIIKFIGAAYLIYLGVSSILSKQSGHIGSAEKRATKSSMSSLTAFREGFLCNVLNPKAALFFLSLFTLIIKPATTYLTISIYAIEMFVIIVAWFCTLTLILSHPRITRLLENAEKYIAKVLGAFLIGLGVVLAFAKNQS